MNRYDFLKTEREKLLERIQSDDVDRAKLLAKLIDIDEELDEIKPNTKIQKPLPRYKRFWKTT